MWINKKESFKTENVFSDEEIPKTGYCYTMSLTASNYSLVIADDNLRIRFKRPQEAVKIVILNTMTPFVDSSEYAYLICSEIPITWKNDDTTEEFGNNMFVTKGDSCSSDSYCSLGNG